MKAIIILISIFVLLFLSIRYLEHKALYFPFRGIESKPEDMGLDYKNVTIITEDKIQLAGWFISSKKPKATLIFCHGNAGNISHRMEKIKIFHELDLDVLIFDYRGYGMSKGKPSENGLYLDAEAVYDYLVNKRKTFPSGIIVYGESLGAAVAVDLASKHETGGIIIEDGFTSVKDMAKRILPFVPAFIYASKFDSQQKIKNIKSPKLIFHSVDDEIVPYEQGKKLYDNASEPKEFVELHGGHNDAFLTSRDIFIRRMDSFVRRL